MWPFLTRTRQKQNEQSDQPKLKFRLLQYGLKLEMFKYENRVALKFWLPKLVAEALEELPGLQSIAMSAMLLEFFLSYVYGVYVVPCFKQRNPDCLKEHQIFGSSSFSYGGHPGC